MACDAALPAGGEVAGAADRGAPNGGPARDARAGGDEGRRQAEPQAPRQPPHAILAEMLFDL